MKLIKGFQDYLITLDGRVFSLYTMSFLKIFVKNNYSYVKIKNKSYLLHRLMAQTYIDNPEIKPQVNHIDGVKTNNYLFNLEWATSSENMQHACKNGLRKTSDLMRENGKKMKVNLLIGRNKYTVKLVLNTETGIYYDSATDAAVSINMPVRKLHRRLNGEIKNTTNFKYV